MRTVRNFLNKVLNITVKSIEEFQKNYLEEKDSMKYKDSTKHKENHFPFSWTEEELEGLALASKCSHEYTKFMQPLPPPYRGYLRCLDCGERF